MITFKIHASSSKASLYTVDDGETKVLLECGLSVHKIRKALNFGLSEISFALLTHSHSDHSRAVHDLLKVGVDVYASQGTIDALGLTGHNIYPVKAGQGFIAKTWAIMPLEAQHDAPEPLSYLMTNSEGERFLFATDTYYLKNRFRRLDVIAVECNYALDILNENVKAGSVAPEVRKRVLRSHFSLHNVKEFLKANDLSRVEEIYLLHLSDDNSHAERFKREVQELTGITTYIAEGDLV